MGSFDWAVAFETGGNSGGYTLANVTVSLGTTVGSPTSLSAKIYADSNNLPGALVKDLGSKTPAGGSNVTWDCTGSGCGLSADATYHLALEADAPTSGGKAHYVWNATGSDSETNTPANAGWEVGDYPVRNRNNIGWSARITSRSRRQVQPDCDAEGRRHLPGRNHRREHDRHPEHCRTHRQLVAAAHVSRRHDLRGDYDGEHEGGDRP